MYHRLEKKILQVRIFDPWLVESTDMEPMDMEDDYMCVCMQVCLRVWRFQHPFSVIDGINGQKVRRLG